MKNTIFTIAGLLFYSFLNSQITAPDIEWQTSFGGTQYDFCNDIIQTPDGGFIAVGQTGSDDGDIVFNAGENDVWVLKLDSLGEIVWNETYGGFSSEFGIAVALASDGGYMILASTSSTDGDIVGNHGNSDIWLLNISENGALNWSKCFGGSNYEQAEGIVACADGTFAFCGSTNSNDGDVTANHDGPGDAWTVKINSAGDILWEKNFGGTDFDIAKSIIESSDGNLVVAGYTHSTDGDINDPKGGYDGIICKFNNTDGSLIWSTVIGKTKDDYINAIAENPAIGFMFTGSTTSNFVGYHGFSDVWVGKLREVGSYRSSHVYGGTGFESGNDIKVTNDGGFIITGYTRSNNGDVSHRIGTNDVWVVKIDAIAKIMWEKTYGGSNLDYGMSIFAMGGEDNHSAIFCGNSYSSDYDVTETFGAGDYWIVKLGCVICGPEKTAGSHTEESAFIFPNPANDKITLYLPSIENTDGYVRYTIFDLMGNRIAGDLIPVTNDVTTEEISLPQSLPSATYIIQVNTGTNYFHIPFEVSK